jgi:Mak16 protein C-terminal region
MAALVQSLSCSMSFTLCVKCFCHLLCAHEFDGDVSLMGLSLLCRKEQQTRRKLEKAETAAKLETTIENELLDRLQKGTYGDIYNFPTREYLKV